MVKKKVLISGGLMKSVNIPDATDAGTTIAGYAGQTLTAAQLKTLLGVPTVPPNTQVPSGGTNNITNNVNVRRTVLIPFESEDPIYAPPGKRGRDGAQGATGGNGAAGTPGGPRGFPVALVAEPEDPPTPILVRGPRGLQGIQGPVGIASRSKIWLPDEPDDPPMFVGRAKAGVVAAVTSLVNISPDTHPASPTTYDDEFEFGTQIDTTGARRAGATGWTLFGAGASAWPVSQGWCVPAGATTAAIFTAPATPWAFTMKMFLGIQNQQLGFMLGNRTTGKAYNIFQFTQNAFDIQLGTINATTWAYAFSSNLTINNALIDVNNGVYYMRVASNGTTLTVSASNTGIEGTYAAIGGRTIATDLGGNILELGFGFGSGNRNAIDWFRRTT